MAMAEGLLRQCVRETIKIISFREEHQVLHGPKLFLRPLMIVPPTTASANVVGN